MRSWNPPRGNFGYAVTALLFLGAGLAACGGGSSSGSSSPTTAHNSSSPSNASAGSATTAAPAAAGNNELSSISSSLASSENGTLKAVYTVVANSQTQTLTIEQKPPESIFDIAQSEILATGKETYFCSASSGQKNCVVEQGANPLAALTALVSPQTVLNYLHAAQAEVAAHDAGDSVSFSSGTSAGQASKCADVTAPTGTGKYCVTDSGALAYASFSTGGSVTLESYSTSVSSSDFAVPAGATQTTIPSISLPSGVTLPAGVTIP